MVFIIIIKKVISSSNLFFKFLILYLLAKDKLSDKFEEGKNLKGQNYFTTKQPNKQKKHSFDFEDHFRKEQLEKVSKNICTIV